MKNGTSFYHYNSLSLYQNKKFTLEFSDGDQLKGVIFKVADAFIDNIVKILDRKRDLCNMERNGLFINLISQKRILKNI